jgi:hypothetical protein
LFDELYRQSFAREEYRALYRFASTPAEAIGQIRDGLEAQAMEAGPPLTKWT